MLSSLFKKAGPIDGIGTLDAYLETFGEQLARQAQRSIPPLHNPATDPLPKMDFLRAPLPAQAHVIAAGVKALKVNRSIFVIGSLGTGKTLMGMCIAHSHAQGKPYRGIVMCPGQLVEKWERELRETLRGVEVYQIPTWHECVRLNPNAPLTKPTWYVIPRDRAKLSSGWRPIRSKDRRGALRCPACLSPIVDKETGTPIPAEKLEQKKHRCAQCNEALWTYCRQFDRWAPATFIKKKLPGFFDYAILDEVHQQKSDTSLTGHAAARLASAAKKTIALTGTLAGGMAEHVRPLLFRLAPASLIAEGYGWEDATAFCETYGRIERRVTTKNDNSPDHRNSTSGSRRNTRVKPVPGIMPTLFGRHLIGTTMFLSLDEVASDLPPLDEQTRSIPLDAEQAEAYDFVEKKLRAAILDMLRQGDNRLLGKMLHTLLGYPDHPHGFGEIGYTDKVTEEWISVVHCPDLDPNIIRPKEQALLDLVAAERKQKRQVWTYVQMTQKRDVLTRLEGLLVGQGHRVKVLRSGVELKDREKWIAKHGKDVDVILSHPQLVETGLDLFQKGNHNFCSLVFYETGYNPFTLMQAAGRHWRIGQNEDCRTWFLYYGGTMQQRAMALMGQKIASAMNLAGKFSSEGLAALAGDDVSMQMALAKTLTQKMADLDPARTWAKVSSRAPKGVRTSALTTTIPAPPPPHAKTDVTAPVKKFDKPPRRVTGSAQLRLAFDW